jgi:hypothetical protein
MGMTGDTTRTAVSITCPSCGEVYATPDQVADVLRNSGFCTNLTCLQDLSAEPLDAVIRRHEGTRRSSDRRAI